MSFESKLKNPHLANKQTILRVLPPKPENKNTNSDLLNSQFQIETNSDDSLQEQTSEMVEQLPDVKDVSQPSKTSSLSKRLQLLGLTNQNYYEINQFLYEEVSTLNLQSINLIRQTLELFWISFN